jgi:hypothetical protein
MTLLTCAAVRRRLPTFHDDELPIADTIAVESHVKECARCAHELSGLRSLGNALRMAAAPGPADDWTGLQPGVISRMKAEHQQSWTARAGRLLDDLHLVWIGLAATTATFLCGALVLGMLHYASPERDDSLAAVIAVVAAPYGSELNPIRSFGSYISVPTVPARGAMADTLQESFTERDHVLALSALVTREGKVADLSVLNNDHDRAEAMKLLDSISRHRLEPARFGASPVAVNLVWLLAHTTVRGKLPRST